MPSEPRDAGAQGSKRPTTATPLEAIRTAPRTRRSPPREPTPRPALPPCVDTSSAVVRDHGCSCQAKPEVDRCATTPGCRSISRSLKRTRALRSACWPSCWAREPDTGADAGEYIYSPVRLSPGRCIPVAQHRGSMAPPRPGGPCGATSSVPRPRPPSRPSATCPSSRGSLRLMTM
jgi:hypothetical protein